MRSTLINSNDGYGWPAILLHWLSFVMAAGLFGVGLYMVELSYYDPLYNVLPYWHKVIGLALFALTLARLLWRAFNRQPEPLAEARWQRLVAKVVHQLLYVVLVLLAVTGYLIPTADGQAITVAAGLSVPALFELSSGTAELVGEAHRWLAYTLAGLVVGHSGAALKHHWLERDRTLKRILWPQSHS